MRDASVSVMFFSKFIYYFLDTFILYLSVEIIKIINFQGDLSDISAKTATLIVFTKGSHDTLRVPLQTSREVAV